MTSLSSLTSSTTSSSSTSSVSSGIGGLVSGLDTDALVESLTAIAQEKIDTQNQKLQKLEWKQEAYRTIISAMQDFEDSYLDVLSSSYLGSTSTFNTTVATSSSDAVSVSTTSSSYEGSFTINSIEQLATAQKITSSSSVTADLTSTVTADSITSSIDDLSGQSISLTLDGVTRTITFDDDFIDSVDSDGFATALQDAIDDSFGVTSDDDRVITVTTDSDGYVNLTASGSELSIDAVDDDTDTIEALGFTDGQANTLSTSTELGELDLATDQGDVETFTFTINDVEFGFDSDVSLSKMISTINSSSAGVTISYSSINDTFTLTADDTGSGDNITVEDTSGTLMAALGLTEDTGTVTEGQNAILYVDGQKVIRSSNSFTVEGVTVELESTSDEEITVTMEADSSDLEDMITQFVDDYNTLIDLLNTYINEDADSDYQPLTDDQKDEMTDDEIEEWEEEAKAGILKGDSTLRSISSNLQQLMYSSAVSGGISLLDLGISTSSYDSNGQLEIDEDALEEALSTYGSEIMELFTTDDTGLADQLEDLFDGAISTSGARGSRGSLVELAGVEDTTSATQNSLYDQMEDVEDLIEVLEDRLTAEQERLWAKFTAMETALSSLESQSSILSSFTSS